jgi:hypothetical protein
MYRGTCRTSYRYRCALMRTCAFCASSLPSPRTRPIQWCSRIFRHLMLMYASEVIAMLRLSAKNGSRERCGRNRPFCKCSKTGCQLAISHDSAGRALPWIGVSRLCALPILASGVRHVANGITDSGRTDQRPSQKHRHLFRWYRPTGRGVLRPSENERLQAVPRDSHWGVHQHRSGTAISVL